MNRLMLIATLPVALLAADAAEGVRIKDARWDGGLMAVISPSPKEQAWLAIPWETDLTDARQKAAAEGKPIFLWEMDGHLLGCT